MRERASWTRDDHKTGTAERVSYDFCIIGLHADVFYGQVDRKKCSRCFETVPSVDVEKGKLDYAKTTGTQRRWSTPWFSSECEMFLMSIEWRIFIPVGRRILLRMVASRFNTLWFRSQEIDEKKKSNRIIENEVSFERVDYVQKELYISAILIHILIYWGFVHGR